MVTLLWSKPSTQSELHLNHGIENLDEDSWPDYCVKSHTSNSGHCLGSSNCHQVVCGCIRMCKVSDLAREHYDRVCENNPVEYCTTNDKHQHYWRASACLVSVVRK